MDHKYLGVTCACWIYGRITLLSPVHRYVTCISSSFPKATFLTRVDIMKYVFKRCLLTQIKMIYYILLQYTNSK